METTAIEIRIIELTGGVTFWDAVALVAQDWDCDDGYVVYPDNEETAEEDGYAVVLVEYDPEEDLRIAA